MVIGRITAKCTLTLQILKYIKKKHASQVFLMKFVSSQLIYKNYLSLNHTLIHNKKAVGLMAQLSAG